MEAILQKIETNLSNKVSIRFAISSKKSDIHVNFQTPIELDPSLNYQLGLEWFSVFNSIHNITKTNNFLYYSFEKNEYKIEIDDGAYEFDKIVEEIHSHFPKEEIKPIKLSLNLSTGKSLLEIKKGYKVDFKTSKLNDLLGYTKKVYTEGKHKSENGINITDLNSINIQCDIVKGIIVNGEQTNILYRFPSDTVPRYAKIIKEHQHPRYMDVTRSNFSNLQIRIIDKDDNLIDFHGEEIEMLLHLKQV